MLMCVQKAFEFNEWVWVDILWYVVLVSLLCFVSVFYAVRKLAGTQLTSWNGSNTIPKTLNLLEGELMLSDSVMKGMMAIILSILFSFLETNNCN